MTGIYKITSPTNKIYIGQSVDIERRKNDYKKYVCHTGKLKNSFKKHGFENHTFEVIEECSIELLNERERFWQDFYDVLGPNGLNLKLTNTTDRSGVFSEELKQKLSDSQKSLKKVLTEEHKLKLLKANTNRIHSEQCRKKNTEGQLRYWTDERKLERSKNNPNSKFTETDIINIRNSKLSQTELGKLYNVDQCTISSIINRKSWKHIE